VSRAPLSAPGVDPERAEWLRQVADATKAAADSLRDLGDPFNHGVLLRDLEEFHTRLVTELDGNNRAVDERGRRIGENEIVFREVNERLRELGEGFSLVSERAEFVCECASTSCTERIQMPISEYEHVRSDPKWFVIVPGHEVPEYERTVTEAEAYSIVEKLPGGPAGLAIRDDPRGPQRN